MRTRIVKIPPWATSWVFGAVVGITLLAVMMFSPITFPLAFAVLVVLVVRSPERAALGGGALIPTGLWFLYALREAVARCAAANVPAGRARYMAYRSRRSRYAFT